MELTITSQKKTIQANVLQLHLYQQSKVIEAMDKRNNYYYVVFYQDQFINVVKPTHMKRHSHVQRAITNGISLPGDHPLVNKLIGQQTLSMTRFNQLFKKLQQHYPPLETALILSFFDSFTTAGSIPKLIKKTYYDFRRNGKMRKALQALYLLKEVDAENTFANDLIGKMEFQKYNEAYQTLDIIMEKDPVYFEDICFRHLQDGIYHENLLMFYDQKNRHIDAIMVRLYLLKQQFNETHWQQLQATIQTWNNEAQINVLSDLYRDQPHPIIEKELTGRLIGSSHHNEVVSFLLEQNYLPTQTEMDKIIDHLNHTDRSQLIQYFHQSKEKFTTLRQSITKNQLEKAITPFIKAFLSTYSFEEINQWFRAFNESNELFLIEQTIHTMEKLQDDPDHQDKLGELYASLDQVEQAIDCYKWEMELHPQNTKAIQAVAHLYKEMGNETEAGTYQDLLIQTQKYG
ncbi:hypothetical protein [Paraliobacillus ryukyuensis]|uniref:hypothetical protein n=1 Tax=Paraliobacillus ryukyuensis TaxID=200904 RepID=UPI0009A697C2|nr:hypothetical protein [Paraliobacillus ryukyuensis]